MANLRISEMATAGTIADSDLFESAKVDGNSASGYMSYKNTMIAIANYIVKLATYSSDLNTSDKHIIGAINELKQLISLIPQFSIEVVQSLPVSDISDTTIYLVPAQSPEAGNYYEEYIHVNNNWELVGSTAVDLSAYYTKLEVDGLLAAKANTADVTAGLALKEDKSAMGSDVRDIYADMKSVKSATITDGIAHFTTIEESALKSLKADLTPIQNLNGYDRPWAGGAGKNKIPLTLANLKSINTTGTWNGNDYTYSGITYSVNLDNSGNVISVTANGTASANSSLYIVAMGTSTLLDYLTNGTNYIVNGCTGGSSSTYLVQIQANGSWYVSSDGDTPFTYTSGNTDRCRIYVASGATVNNQLFKPMVRLATESDSSFAPYENICPIYGHTQEVITNTDEDETTETHTIDLNGTYYGGNLDVKNGVLTVTDGYIAEYNGETLPSTWISDRDVYAPNTTPTIGAEVVYKLATPTTVALTPTEIKALAGDNNVSASTGAVSECKYTELATSEDIPSGGGIDYSTDEQDTGLKWIDGRKVYQKTYLVNNPVQGGSNYTVIDNAMSNVDYLISSEGYLMNSTSGAGVGLGAMVSGGEAIIQGWSGQTHLLADGNLVLYGWNTGYMQYDRIIVTVKYVKKISS